jgi:hypothetical protein
MRNMMELVLFSHFDIPRPPAVNLTGLFVYRSGQVDAFLGTNNERSFARLSSIC